MSEGNIDWRNRRSQVQAQVAHGEDPARALPDETSDEGYEAAEARTGDDPRASAPRDSTGQPSTGLAD